MQSVAIAHKDYDVRGGGEILAETLADGLDAPLYVGHGDNDKQPDDLSIDITEIAPGSKWHWLQSRGGVPRAIGHWMLWRDHAPKILDEYDTVITSGNEPQWWTPRDDQTWIAYTHSTPRWLYDLYNDLDGWTTRTLNQVKRWIYQQDMGGADLFVANSDVVARRLQRYWQIPESRIEVIYPPIETERLSPDIDSTKDYYLSLGRLAATKQIDRLIEAANALDFDLKIAGTGPQEDYLKKLAGDTVEFLGWVEGEQKRELLSGAKALLTACRNEDFGMVHVEAIASGTPVITVAEGMPQYTVLEPECGYTYETDLEGTIQQFEEDGVTWSEKRMAQWADETFSKGRFITEMEAAIETAKEYSAIDPKLKP